MPLIEKGFPEVSRFHCGTINIRFDAKIIVAGWDHRTPPIHWFDQSTAAEVFDLVRVRLMVPDVSVQVRALLYVAHWSPHRNDPQKHEFLAPFIRGLRHEMPVKLECDRDCVELPYTASEVGVNGRRQIARTFVIL
jgi:hypothetical protein